MKNKLSNNRGFTLLEVIITITISLLIFILISGVYLLSQKVYFQTDSRSEISQNGRVILDRMIREIRQAKEIATQLPTSNSNPEQLPSEIMFQNGHDTQDIRYLRYFLDGNELKRQEVVFYFPRDPQYYVRFYDTDKEEPHDPPIRSVLEEKVIGEYIADLEFWGERLININLELQKNGQNMILFTSVYGRNL